MNQIASPTRARMLHAKLVFCLLVVAVLLLTLVAWSQAEEGLHLPTSAITYEAPFVSESWRPVALPVSAELSSFEIELVDLVNAERMRNGLSPLAIHPALRNAALGHSQDMSANDFFGHDGSDGSYFVDRLTRAGYTYITAAGENIAAGFASPGAVFDAWMSSSGHRANILNPIFRDIGIGYVYEAGDTYPDGWGYHHYWTQDFGAQASPWPSPTPSLTPTRTRTPTPTLRLSPTATPSVTATCTPASTLRPSPTATPSRTLPPSATWTATPTASPSATATWILIPPSSTPTCSPTATRIPTWTRTPTPTHSPEGPPDPATVIGAVVLQARAARPNPTWRVPLWVSLYQNSQLAAGPLVAYTDENGEFTLSRIAAGVYDIRLKNLHTLANIKHTVELLPGLNRLELGTLLEGDASDDNIIDIMDFSLLRTFFGTSSAQADFNQDGIVDVVDFSLLRTHFGLAGDIAVP